MTSGASCPDAIVEAVIEKIAGFYLEKEKYAALLSAYMQ
jgi:4-hydroxy-3-methylbut-2-enyl diphosphate reductase IspH